MAGEFLLDTNTAIRLLENDQAINRKMADAVEVLLSAIVLGELYFGALNSRRSNQNLARLEDFAKGIEILLCDMNTAKVYGGIKTHLRAAGHPIPENDLWIAATAIEHDLILVSRDAHFDYVTNLKTTRW